MPTIKPATRGHVISRSMLIAALLAALTAEHASGCALEGDDVTLQRVVLNIVYPESLYVLGAVSSARLSGRIDRTLRICATPKDLRSAAFRINAALCKLRARLASDAPAEAPPALAIVLLEPMLWSRLSTEAGTLKLAFHVDGPVRGDVVAVTEEPVIAAINGGTLSAGDALSLGLLRLYGNAPDVASARAWLRAGDRPARVEQRGGPGAFPCVALMR